MRGSGATLAPSMATRTALPVVPVPNARARPPATLALRLRARATELADGFRRSNRFFKMRLGIVAAWAVLSLATLWGACVTPGPTNALGADVQVNGDSIMGVQLLVRNESAHIWEDGRRRGRARGAEAEQDDRQCSSKRPEPWAQEMASTRGR